MSTWANWRELLAISLSLWFSREDVLEQTFLWRIEGIRRPAYKKLRKTKSLVEATDGHHAYFHETLNNENNVERESEIKI
jgi:hypothetical protein